MILPLAIMKNDWESFIKIEIDHQNFLAYCDLGSTASIMPKVVYDSLTYKSLVDDPFYHSHANGTISKILGRANGIPVVFRNKMFPIDFIILEKFQGNIVLGRSFLKAAECFINVKYGFMKLNSSINRKMFFPCKVKDNIIEGSNDFDTEDVDQT